MTDALPQALADYFEGKNARDFARAVSGFAPDATVDDEAQQQVGAEAILRWMTRTDADYNDQAQVLGSTTDGDRTVVTAIVSGTFPGSPIELRYAFTLRDGQITSLAIDS